MNEKTYKKKAELAFPIVAIVLFFKAMRKAVVSVLSLGAAEIFASASVSDPISLLDEHTIRIVDASVELELNAGWLRERCTSPMSVHQETRQPLRTFHRLPKDAEVVKRAWMGTGGDVIDHPTLFVEFGDGHQTQVRIRKFLCTSCRNRNIYLSQFQIDMLKNQLNRHQHHVSHLVDKFIFF